MSDYQKIKITEIIYELVKDKLDTNTDINKIFFTWWVTGRTGNGLRLTEEGQKAFELADLTYYDFPLFTENLQKINNTILTKFTLDLGKKIKCPFYVGLKNRQLKTAYIRIYDSKIAMLISLYGTLKDYLEATKS